jgi:hypothetical protein
LRMTRRDRRTVGCNFPRYEDRQSGTKHDYEEPCCLSLHDYAEGDSQFLQNAARHSTRRHIPQYCILHIHRCEQSKLQIQKGCSKLLATECLIVQPAISGTSSFRLMRRFRNTGKNRILALSCLSVRTHGKDRLPLDEFS